MGSSRSAMTGIMDVLLSSPQYRKNCELIGKLLVDHGRQKDGNAAPSFKYRAVQFGNVAQIVVASLKRLEFRAIMEPQLLTTLISLAEGYNELRGFRQLFIGLRGLLEFTHEEQENW